MSSDSYKQILTPANIVTTVRIALVPIFVVVFLAPWPSWVPDLSMQSTLEFFKPWVAAAVFALLAFTDSVDGYLARSRNEVTTLGKFLDPLADKILVSAALLALLELNELPAWVVLVIIAREFLVSGLRMVVSAEGHVVAASIWGKVKTVVQIIAIILFIIKANPELVIALGSHYNLLYYGSWAVMIIALLLTLFSMADYFYKVSGVLGLPIKKATGATNERDTRSLSTEVIEKASELNLTIGTAESCTGGLIAKSLTDIAGSSEVFAGSVVSYSNQVKMHSLGVAESTLDTVGAVSEETAREMAQGALLELGVECAVSTTGIAGPGGGSDEKPVGTVWIGLAYKCAHANSIKEKSDTAAQSADSPDAGSIKSAATCFHFTGNRGQIREKATNEALKTLLEYLTAQTPEE